MKSLIFNIYDTQGGASRAAYRLHKGLRLLGVDSLMLVWRKYSDDNNVYPIAQSRLKKAINYGAFKVDPIPLRLYKCSGNNNFSPAWVAGQASSHGFIVPSDIIHLHWICAGLLRPESLSKFRKPIIWTLHDMWPFTGGCHYAGDCLHYQEECGFCPQLGSNKKRDISSWIWRRKKRSWRGINLTIVAPSRWLAACAKKSSLFGDLRVEVVPYGIDINRFKPVDKMFTRETLGLPLDKKIILLGAGYATDYPRKGYQYLEKTLLKLLKSGWNENLELAVLGTSASQKILEVGLPVHYLGYLHDDISLAISYSAADLVITPSVEDNFPNTVLESLACGTPVVAFRIGGMPDLIEHRSNGYLAKPFDCDDLTNGIIWVLEDNARYKQLIDRAREKVVEEFTLENQARQYLKIYNEIL